MIKTLTGRRLLLVVVAALFALAALTTATLTAPAAQSKPVKPNITKPQINKPVKPNIPRPNIPRPERPQINRPNIPNPNPPKPNQPNKPNKPNEPKTETVQILGLNETHGQLVPLTEENDAEEDVEVGGLPALSTYLKNEEKEAPGRTLTIASGDIMQGPAISSYFQGKPTIKALNVMGLDATGVGNHEFDWGRDVLDKRISEADFPFLANNIVRDSTDEQEFAPYKVFNLKGVKVGVVGLGNPDTKNLSLPSATEGLSFLDIQDSANETAKSVKELQKRKVGAIVLAPHIGLESRSEGDLADVLNALPEKTAGDVDFVLGGHIPTDIKTKVNGIPVIQPYGNTRGYSDVTLTVNKQRNDVVKYKGSSDRVITDEVKGDPKVQKIVDKFQDKIDEALGETVGEATTSILRGADGDSDDRSVESEMGNFVSDSMREYFPDVDFAFTNAGGLRADIDQGPITLEEIYAVLPFNNTLVTMNLTGAQVTQVLEEGANSEYGTVQVSGLEWTYTDNGKDADNPVTSVTLPNGDPIDPNATYKIVTNNFMSDGGDGFTTLTEGENTADTQLDLVESVTKYLEDNSPVDPQIEDRITVE